MRKLHDTTGAVTRREVLLITLIIAMSLFFVSEGLRYLYAQQRKGDDALRANTAMSVARANSGYGTGCPVTNCTGGVRCVHEFEGSYIGFYDDVSNTIVGERPRGYNEAETMTIGGMTWHGEAGTMVIRVLVEDEEISLGWEHGKG